MNEIERLQEQVMQQREEIKILNERIAELEQSMGLIIEGESPKLEML